MKVMKASVPISRDFSRLYACPEGAIQPFKSVSLCLLILLLLLLIFSFSPCRATTISVGPDDSIQAAIAVARPGDVIAVMNGTYYEHVRVDKPLVLQGLGMPVLDATASGAAIILKADGITIKGFRIKNAGSWPREDSKTAGIEILSDGNLVTENDISNNFNGLLILGNNNIVEGNCVVSNLGFGIKIDGGENNSIRKNCLVDSMRDADEGGNGTNPNRNLWDGNCYGEINASENGCQNETCRDLCGFRF